MPEISTVAKQFDRKDAYRTNRDPIPDIDTVKERIAMIALPEDLNERASDIARNFRRPEDIRLLLAAIHDVAVPGFATRETDFASVADNGHDEPTTLASPEERTSVFGQASDLLNSLSSMRMLDGSQDQAYLDRVGNVVALASVWAHTYADGNGRTARVTADLLRYGPNSANLEIAMKGRDEYGPEDIRISSYVPKKTFSPSEALSIAASLDIPLLQEADYLERSGSAFTTPYTG